MHKVVWRQNDKFDDVLSNYVNCLKNHYLNNCTVVFDGYPDKGEEKHTKSAGRHQRGRLNCAPEVVCDIDIVSKLPEDKFLSNEKNKRNLIEILSEKLQDEGFIVKQAVENADCLIINTVISVSNTYESVYVVGEDVDLLVILSRIAQARKNIYLLKPSRQSVEEKLYSSSSFQYPEIQHFICFIHAFIGCDTTSSLYKQGKAKLIKLFMSDCKSLESQERSQLFNDPTTLKSLIQASGQNIIMTLYGAREKDNFRYDEFQYLCHKVKPQKYI